MMQWIVGRTFVNEAVAFEVFISIDTSATNEASKRKRPKGTYEIGLGTRLLKLR